MASMNNEENKGKGAAEEPEPEPDDASSNPGAASYDPTIYQRPHPEVSVRARPDKRVRLSLTRRCDPSAASAGTGVLAEGRAVVPSHPGWRTVPTQPTQFRVVAA